MIKGRGGATDLGVFDVTGEAFTLIELAPGVSLDEVVEWTDAPVEDRREG
ncbi:hypothetical protein GCM10027030_24730 [Luteococcus sediminum]